MKSTFLVYIDPRNPASGLRVATADEWTEILNENRKLEREHRRFFICDSIREGNEQDQMFIETTREEYDKWHTQCVLAARKRKREKKYKTLSLDQPIPGTDYYYADDVVDDFDLSMMIDNDVDMILLRKKLEKWQPWAVEMMELYLDGKKKEVTVIFSKRYGTSTRTVQRWKEQFDAYVKKFFGIL